MGKTMLLESIADWVGRKESKQTFQYTNLYGLYSRLGKGPSGEAKGLTSLLRGRKYILIDEVDTLLSLHSKAKTKALVKVLSRLPLIHKGFTVFTSQVPIPEITKAFPTLSHLFAKFQAVEIPRLSHKSSSLFIKEYLGFHDLALSAPTRALLAKYVRPTPQALESAGRALRAAKLILGGMPTYKNVRSYLRISGVRHPKPSL
jgi:hypothetical protein